MKKADILKALFNYPGAVLKKGLLAQQERQSRKGLLASYQTDQLPTIDILDLFPVFEEELSTYSFLEGTSLVTDMILLKKLAKGFSDCNYLEIGSWRGESLINISEVAKHCTSITLSPEEMKNMGIKKEIIALHAIFSKHAKNVTEYLHNSFTFDFSKLKPNYDLIFIDGDHSYEGVLNDTKKTFSLRKDASSVMVWHDYGFSTETVRYTVLKAIMDGIPADKHKNLYHVSNTMCAVYMENKTLPSSLISFPSFPNKRFSVQVKAHKL